MPTLRLPIPAPPISTAEVFITFEPLRGRIVSIRGSDDPSKATEAFALLDTPSALELVRHIGTVEGPVGTTTDSMSEILVEYEGDRPVVSRIIFTPLGDRDLLKSPVVYVLAHPGDGCLGIGPAWQEHSYPNQLTAADVSPEGHAKHLRQFLKDAADNAKTTHRAFFFDLDLETHHRLMPYLSSLSVPERQSRQRAVEQAIIVLENRVAERLSTGTTKPRPEPLAIGHLKVLSAIIQRLIEKHYMEFPHVINVAKVEEAFEMFANGELRLRLPTQSWACQPSGASYFHFGELAFAALELDVHSALWSSLANVLVRTQHLYAATYAPTNPEQASRSDYHACRFDSSRQTSGTEKSLVRAALERASEHDLSAAHTANLIRFFPGEAGPRT